MAGRGRGRGRGSTLSFNLDSLGVQRGEMFSGPVNQPLPLFPAVANMAIPNASYDPADLKLLEIKRRMREKFQKRWASLTLEEKKKDIERYSDKYQLNQQEEQAWTPDWTQFPHELRPAEAKKRKRALNARPNLKAARTSKSVSVTDILENAKNRLATGSAEGTTRAENEEKEDDDEEEKEEGEGEEEEEEELDEEEETDYNLTYFDNGEGYGDDDEEDDEPAYS